jgi:DNA ligase-1
LVAAYDDKRDIFTSISKVGTGFSDEDLAKLPKLLKNYESEVKPPEVESKMVPDSWFKPHLVIEVIASELTLSPIHTAATDKIRKGSGLALRFPKFTGKIRDDKTPKDATTVTEIVEIYQSQVRQLKAAPKGG